VNPITRNNDPSTYLRRKIPFLLFILRKRFLDIIWKFLALQLHFLIDLFATVTFLFQTVTSTELDFWKLMDSKFDSNLRSNSKLRLWIDSML